MNVDSKNNLIFDKPFNNENDNRPVLKLIDFGNSRIIEPNEIYDTCIGTINYMSPEMLRERTGDEIKKSYYSNSMFCISTSKVIQNNQ